MKKLTIEQMKKLEAAICTLYQLENELSSNFEGNYQDTKDIHALLGAADQLVRIYKKWKEIK